MFPIYPTNNLFRTLVGWKNLVEFLFRGPLFIIVLVLRFLEFSHVIFHFYILRLIDSHDVLEFLSDMSEHLGQGQSYENDLL